MKKIIYYDTIEEDVVTSNNQDYKLKENYKYYHKNIIYRFFSFLLYLIFLVIAFIYSKLVLKVSIKNKKVLKGHKKMFIYANHTQMLGDVLDPFIYLHPVRPYAICSPANYGIPVLGKLLPMLGGIPTSDTISGLKKIKETISYHINHNKAIVIYPEAHLWPYYTGIRPFASVSFHFPVDEKVASFCVTRTYTKRKLSKKPKITIYIDGPYYPKEELSRKENISYLHYQIYNKMIERSKLSNYDYIKYIQKENRNN